MFSAHLCNTQSEVEKNIPDFLNLGNSPYLRNICDLLTRTRKCLLYKSYTVFYSSVCHYDTSELFLLILPDAQRKFWCVQVEKYH